MLNSSCRADNITFHIGSDQKLENNEMHSGTNRNIFLILYEIKYITLDWDRRHNKSIRHYTLVITRGMIQRWSNSNVLNYKIGVQFKASRRRKRISQAPSRLKRWIVNHVISRLESIQTLLFFVSTVFSLKTHHFNTKNVEIIAKYRIPKYLIKRAKLSRNSLETKTPEFHLFYK